ncbi:MAG: MBL fold metallo-hydrolase [Planctomycetes bacterium]|nr:MBL fold metallo-hydrolase [Planctomycetota bacterium]
MKWQPVIPGVWLFPDSCNVYAVHGPTGMLIIDAGTGAWVDHLNELPAAPAALACTHYFRDHAAGALPASRRGIPVFVPAYEREIFADPAEHFRRRETYIIYDNLWNLYAPIQGVPVAGDLLDYDTTTLAGLKVHVLPLPGATLTQVGLSVELPAGRVVFCGETIHSPGKVPRVAPYQYNYNDLGGATNTYWSLQQLRDHKPTALMPSLGTPILRDADAALAATQDSLRAMCDVRHGLPEMIKQVGNHALEKVTDHVWRDTESSSLNWYVVSKSGKALVIDYGYFAGVMSFPSYPNPPHRRPLLHGIEGLKQQFGIDRIDTVLISHFHDDHVCGIPLLQRLFGTRAWAAKNFAHLLEHPEAHCFPCNWPQKITIDRRIPLNEKVQWEEYTFHFAPMTGHTRFSALIGFEADGKRYAHTGDQYFFLDFGDHKTPWTKRRRLQNHVYRNGALLDGYEQSAGWMLDWRPDIVIQGHQPPFFTDAEFFKHIEQWVHDYRTLHEKVMPLGADEAHFDLDSWGGWIWPYRTHLPKAGPAEVTVTVRNPLPRPAKLELTLVGPDGWKGTSVTLDAPARAEVTTTMRITPAGPCRRQPFAVDLRIGEQLFGQVAEALMTVGGEMF